MDPAKIRLILYTVIKERDAEVSWKNMLLPPHSPPPRNDSNRNSIGFLFCETVVRSVLFRIPRNILFVEVGNPNISSMNSVLCIYRIIQQQVPVLYRKGSGNRIARTIDGQSVPGTDVDN